MQSDLPRLLEPSTSPSLSRRAHCALPRLSELDNYPRTAHSASATITAPPFASINSRPHPLPESDTATSAPQPNVPLTPPPTSGLHSPPVAAPTERENWSSIKTLPHNPGNQHAQLESTNHRLPRISEVPLPTASRSESTSYPSNVPSRTHPEQNGSRGPDPALHGSRSPCEPSSSAWHGVVKDDSGTIRNAQTVPTSSPFKRPARPTTPPSQPSSSILQSSPSASAAPPNGNSFGSQTLRYSNPPSPAQTPKASTKALPRTDRPQSHMVRSVGRSNSAEAMPPPSSPSQWTADRPERTGSHPPKNTTVPLSPSSIPAAAGASNQGPIATKLQPGVVAYPSLHAPTDGRTLGLLATLKCDVCKVRSINATDALVMQFSPYPHKFQCQDCQAKAAGETEHNTRTQSNKRKSPPSPDSFQDEASFKTRKVAPDRPPSAGREPDWFATPRPSDPDGRQRLTVSAASALFNVLIKVPETDEEISQDRQLRDTVYKLGPPQADRLDGTCHR